MKKIARLYDSLTSKPGEFHARCSLRRRVPEKRMNSVEISAAKAAGYERAFNRMESERVDPTTRVHGRWEWLLPECEGFETTDRAEFERHMLEEHGRKAPNWLRGEAETFAASINAGWKAPRLLTDGKDLPKAAGEQLRVCPTCDLHGHVDTNAGELWWDEHVRGCALAAAS
jgi:hypothetical protein